jgi:hypothetical protein
LWSAIARNRERAMADLDESIFFGTLIGQIDPNLKQNTKI